MNIASETTPDLRCLDDDAYACVGAVAWRYDVPDNHPYPRCEGHYQRAMKWCREEACQHCNQRPDAHCPECLACRGHGWRCSSGTVHADASATNGGSVTVYTPPA